MNPSAYNDWWKKRVEKEEQQYAKHILIQKNRREHYASASLGIKLSSLGTPQVAVCHPVLQDTAQATAKQQTCSSSLVQAQYACNGPHALSHNNSIATVGKPCQDTRILDRLQTGMARKLLASSRPASSRPTSSISTSLLQGSSASGTNPAPTHNTPLRNCYEQAQGAACSIVSEQSSGVSGQGSYRTDSTANMTAARTPKSSVAGSSVATSKVLSRLEHLEAELTSEKNRRRAAEAELKQLLASGTT